MQNQEVHMTKEVYFDMCEQLGEEPIEEAIPIDYEDLPDLVQTLLNIYGIMSDNWDPMGGNYLGKDYQIVFNLFDLYQVEIPDRLIAMTLLQHIDGLRSKSIQEKLKAKTPPAKQ